MASSITGHPTWEELNRLARPNHSTGALATGDGVGPAAWFTITLTSSSGVSRSALVKSSERSRPSSRASWASFHSGRSSMRQPSTAAA